MDSNQDKIYIWNVLFHNKIKELINCRVIPGDSIIIDEHQKMLIAASEDNQILFYSLLNYNPLPYHFIQIQNFSLI